ncbi:MAG: pectate lyase [Phycisphaerae bacterium]|nr:pectate lyase [Phycisphaerae bacterium]
MMNRLTCPLLLWSVVTLAAPDPGAAQKAIQGYVGDPNLRVVDFSYAGYAANERALPQARVQVVVPNVPGDDTQRIQAALDYVGTLGPDSQGIRGAVLLSPGPYEVAGQLILRHSGVVLRGSGPGGQGTVVTATGRDRRALIRILGRADRSVGPALAVDGPVPVGAFSVNLAEAGAFKPGDRVLVTRPSTEQWVVAIGMSKFWMAERAPRIWKAGELDIAWDRTVRSISGTAVTLDAPLTMDLDPRWGGGTVASYSWPGRIEQVGVENLQLVSACDPSLPKDEDHAWMGVTLEHVQDAWVRGVTFRGFCGSAVSVWETASRVTVADCQSLDPVSEEGGWRRHTFFTAGQQTLFLRCYSEHGRHDFGVGHCAPGPHAFVHCDARMALDDSGPIGAWTTGVLYDNVNIDGDGLRLGYRGTDLQFCGWNAAYCMLWQCTAAEMDCYRPPMAQNWAIGCWAIFEGDGHWSAFNEFADPRSLMQALVADRLGPEAARFIGEGVVHPSSSGRSSPDRIDSFTASSNGPAPQLTEVIAESIRSQALSTDPAGVQTIDTILARHQDLVPPKPQPGSRQLTLVQGRLLVGDRLLTGKTMETYWWRGKTAPQSVEFQRAAPELTRFVPGRTGKGWTDDLEELASTLAQQGYAAVYQHPGLWYDRRREDHERVRRMDGEVWAPFDEMPFARSGQGRAWDGLSRYDLTRYNPWYFDRLDRFAQEAQRHGLVLLNNHYFQHNILEAGAHWADFAWRSANNINNTGFPEPVPYVGDKYIYQAHLFYDVNHPARRDLHRAYIRHHLARLADRPNVIHMTSGEFTGPVEFVRFWLDTIGDWEKETGRQALAALSCTYDVQEAILNDPARAALVDVIDIRYWSPQADGSGSGPRGGISLAPRQQGWSGVRAGGGELRAAIDRYRTRFPDKAVICSAAGFQPAGD